METARYPGIAEYNQAAQHPASAFADPELSSGCLATSGLGLPIVLGGGFALTYTVSSGRQKFAVRCFHRFVPDLEQQYAQIGQAIGEDESHHFVAFEYQSQGIRVRSSLYPIVKMAWADGPTLGTFLAENYGDSAAVGALSRQFHELSTYLGSRRIAHGDLENGNMVVRDGALTLIDYDGMYVPSMPTGNGNELGHAHFQHPGRTTENFGPRIDDFSFILMDVSLDAIAADKSLYEEFCNGDNVLFEKSDFLDPAGSKVFQRLKQMPKLADKVDDFASICQRPIEQVPSLEAFSTRHRPPQSTVVRTAARRAPTTSKPAGMRNIDFIRNTLGPRPSPLEKAVSQARVASPVGGGRAPASNSKPPPDQSTVLTYIFWAQLLFAVVVVAAIFSAL